MIVMLHRMLLLNRHPDNEKVRHCWNKNHDKFKRHSDKTLHYTPITL